MISETDRMIIIVELGNIIGGFLMYFIIGDSALISSAIITMVLMIFFFSKEFYFSFIKDIRNIKNDIR
jgi:hypothetical protein